MNTKNGLIDWPTTASILNADGVIIWRPVAYDRRIQIYRVDIDYIIRLVISFITRRKLIMEWNLLNQIVYIVVKWLSNTQEILDL